MNNIDSDIKDKNITPFALSCSSCGSSMRFDIVKQNYACDYCGNTEFSDVRKRIFDKWTSDSTLKLKENSDVIRECSCPQCGSVVQTMDDSQTIKCYYCETTMITSDFLATNDYPVAIIPFKINLDEAKKLVEKELNNSLSGLGKKYRKKIKENIGKIRAVYLPFQLFTGPIDVEVTRFKGRRTYNLKSYMNQKVVIACENVDNDLIDKIEPFNMDQLVPFEFLYISGHQAKTQDIEYTNLERDLQEELEKDMIDSLSQQFATKQLDVKLDLHDEMTMPVLLPVFILNIEGAKLSINGQTGKIAVKDDEEKVSHKWMIPPTVYTLIVGLITAYLSKDQYLTFSMMLVFAIIIFAIYSDANRRILYNKFFAAEDVYTREGKRLAKAGIKFKPTFQAPIFYENIVNKVIPVDIKFVPLRLKIGIFLAILILILLPEIISSVVTPFLLAKGISFSEILNRYCLAQAGTAVWKCIAIPFSVIIYFSVIRHEVYNRVFFRPYGSEVGYKYLKEKHTKNDDVDDKDTNKKSKKDQSKKEKSGCFNGCLNCLGAFFGGLWIVAFIVFVLIVSVSLVISKLLNYNL